MFNLNEIDSNPLPMEWLEMGFGIDDLEEFMNYEAKENFKTIPSP